MVLSTTKSQRQKVKNPKKQARKPLLTMALGSKLKKGNKEMQIRSKLRTKVALHWRRTKVALHQMKKIIVGDSIIKGLRRDLLSWVAKRPVTVRSFPGATTADMKHYLPQSLEAKPKAIVLHVGTNDLKNSSSGRNVAEKIIDLGNVIATNSPDT